MLPESRLLKTLCEEISHEMRNSMHHTGLESVCVTQEKRDVRGLGNPMAGAVLLPGHHRVSLSFTHILSLTLCMNKSEPHPKTLWLF